MCGSVTLGYTTDMIINWLPVVGATVINVGLLMLPPRLKGTRGFAICGWMLFFLMTLEHAICHG